MKLDEINRKHYLEKAIEIARSAASSGGPACAAGSVMAELIQMSYDKMIEIAEKIDR